nr:autotransporter outer membrane beta-barrel domain-containing protein [Bradyrhizobium sp. LCT2]
MMTKAPPQTFAQRWSVWAAGFGGSQWTDGNAAGGSNAATSRIVGTVVGADYRLSPYTLLGFALAGGGTSFGVNGLGSGRSDLFQAAAYLRHTSGSAYLSAALAYGWQAITTDRTATIAGADHLRAEFDANAYSGRLEGGYRHVAPWIGGIGITPYGALQFTTLDLPAYAEQAVAGSAAFALRYAARTVTDTRSELGLRTDRSFAMQAGVLTLRGRLAWAHDFNPDRSDCRDLPGAAGRELRRQRRCAGSRLRAHHGFRGDELAEWLVRGGELRRRVLERHPQLRRQGQRSLRLVGRRLRHALLAGQGTTCPDITSRSRPLSLAA